MRTFEAIAPPGLETGDVMPVVQALFGDTAVPLSCALEVLHPNPTMRATGGVFRCGGEALVRGERQPWSAVLKVLRLLPWRPSPEDLQDQLDDGGDQPADWAYWLREALVYEDGLLCIPRASFRAPQLLAVTRPSDDQRWLWLEDIHGTPGTAWDAGRWLAAAEHLGELQGHFAEHPPSSRAWFGPSYLSTAGPQHRIALLRVFDEPATWENPIIGAVFSRHDVALAQAVGRRCRELTTRANTVPDTLCHRDLSPDNLFADGDFSDGDARTVAIDWTQTGLGPIGEDIATMFGLTARRVAGRDGFVDYERALLNRYLRGLRTAGCTEDRDRIDETFRITSALHTGILVGLLASDLKDPAWRARKEREEALPLVEIVADRYALMAHTLRHVAGLLDAEDMP